MLLGRLTRPLPELPKVKGGILPMDDLPTTPRLTTIRYGEQPSVTVVRKDGKRETKDLAWFLDLNNTGLKPTAEQNAAAFGDIQEFVLTYPFESGKAGIVLLDSPGIFEDEEGRFIAQRAVNECDAAIMLFRSDCPFSQMEREFVRDMISRGLTSYFTVINRWDGRVVDERLRSYVWWKRVTELEGGPPYNRSRFRRAEDLLRGRQDGPRGQARGRSREDSRLGDRAVRAGPERLPREGAPAGTGPALGRVRGKAGRGDRGV